MHVRWVTVFRCGYYPEEGEAGGCGDEGRCRNCEWLYKNVPEIQRNMNADGIAYGDWPTEEITHRQFVHEYGRCPAGCEVAKQLELIA